VNAQPNPNEPPEILRVRRIDVSELGAKLTRPPAPPAPPARKDPPPRAQPNRAPQPRNGTPPQAQPLQAQPPPAPPDAAPQPRNGMPPQAQPPPAPPDTAPQPRNDTPPRTQPEQARQPTARPPARIDAPVTAKATPKAAAARAPEAQAQAPKPWLSTGKVLFTIVCLVLYFGWSFPTERYISPKRGFGYALGIVGGSLMLLLLVYSLRKRWSWLRFLGSTPSWFRFHMVLGILGPLCILYHSNFSTGATNSNVALFCMLTVAGSGLVGRYIYARIHHGLYGRKLQLGELRESAESLRGQAGISFLPELAARLDAAEQQMSRAGARLSLLGVAKPVIIAFVSLRLRWRLQAYVRRALRASARANPVIASQRTRLRATARAYITRRLVATRRVAVFASYERLFSLWHTLHVPLIFLMIIAAVVHVIAVHVY
jgi:hypothetical protein